MQAALDAVWLMPSGSPARRRGSSPCQASPTRQRVPTEPRAAALRLVQLQRLPRQRRRPVRSRADRRMVALRAGCGHRFRRPRWAAERDARLPRQADDRPNSGSSRAMSAPWAPNPGKPPTPAATTRCRPAPSENRAPAATPSPAAEPLMHWQSASTPGPASDAPLLADGVFIVVCAVIWVLVMMALLVGLCRRLGRAAGRLALNPRIERRAGIAVGTALGATVLDRSARSPSPATSPPTRPRLPQASDAHPSAAPMVVGDHLSGPDTANRTSSPPTSSTSRSAGPSTSTSRRRRDPLLLAPNLAGKMDLIPGRENQITFTADTPGR